MALSIKIRLRDGRYDAAISGDRMEWPPHPARLFNALVASADHHPADDGFTADTAALRWLEQAGPPVIWAPAAEPSYRHGFAVTNAIDPKPTSQRWPGRTNKASHRWSALPAGDEVVFAWPNTAADDTALWRLTRLSRRVAYLGRSTSTVHIEVGDDIGDPKPDWVAYRPVPLGTSGAAVLRVPYAGYLDDLRAAYDTGQQAWEISRSVAYAPDGAPSEETAPVAVPFRDLLIFPLQRGVPVHGGGFLTVTEVLRQTVIRRIADIADSVPPQACGHGADTSRHLAFLPVLDVGHRHARGHLLGVAVAIPSDLPDEDRPAVLQGLYNAPDPVYGSGPIRELRMGSSGVIRLADPFQETPDSWGLDPQRWTGPDAGARQWVTVTPVMLDRYPSRHDQAEDLLAAAFVTAGYPEPDAVTVLEAPILRGAVTRPRRGTLPAGRDRRPMLHCHVRFSEPVRGPVIAGALRYLGCGLLVPEVTP